MRARLPDLGAERRRVAAGRGGHHAHDRAADRGQVLARLLDQALARHRAALPTNTHFLLLEDGGAARTGVLGERQRAAVHRVRSRASESARCEAKTVLQVMCISQTL